MPSQNLTGAADGGVHAIDVTNASRTLLMSIKTLQWYDPLLRFFGLKPSILPRIVSSSEVYGNIKGGPLDGIPVAGMIGDQQAALVGNKCLSKGEAKNTYGTGSFVLFNTGQDVVRSENGLISTLAYQLGPKAKATYALEGSIAVAGSAIKWYVPHGSAQPCILTPPQAPRPNRPHWRLERDGRSLRSRQRHRWRLLCHGL